MRRPGWRFLFVALFAWACASDTTAPSTLASITVSLSSRDIVIGETSQASATLLDNTGNSVVVQGDTVHWISQDAGVATVSTTGVIRGIGQGNTTITAVFSGKTGSAQIIVRNPPIVGPPPVASVSVSLSLASVIVGGTTLATANIKDASGNLLSGKTIIWQSAAPAIATVSATGVVTGVAPGTASIQATVDGIAGTATVTVNPPPIVVSTVEVALAQSSLVVGFTTQATAITRDVNGAALGRAVAWSTSNFDVASVSQTGFVTALTAGTAQITATSEGKTGFATVTVTRPVVTVPTGSITLSLTGPILVGATAQANAVVLDPLGVPTPGAVITYASGNTAIATVSSTGLVTGVAAGTTSITATSGTFVAVASITVNAPVVPPAGTATQLGFLTFPSTSATSGIRLAVQPVIQVRDAANQPVNSNVSVTVNLSAGIGAVNGTATVTAVNGIATFTDLHIDGVANTNVAMRFAATGLTPAVASGINLVQVPASLTVATQPAGAVSATNLATQPSVVIRDNGFVPITASTLPITAAITSGTGALSGTTTVNAVGGTATFTNLRVTGSGSHVITFSTPSPALSAVSSAFSVSSAVASQLVLSQQPANGVSGLPLPTQPIVEVRDVSNNLITGTAIAVTAAVVSGSGAASGTTTVITSTGVAQFSDLRISGGGINTLRFSIASPALSVTADPITVTQISSISRDGGSVNGGGVVVQIKGNGFGPTDVVNFGPNTASGFSQVDAFTLQVTVPAGSVGSVPVTVTHNGVTASLANGWTYYPAPSVLLANTDFESGYGLGILPVIPSGNDSVYITTELAHSGTHSVKQVATRSGINDVAVGGGAIQTDILGGNGRYHRYYLYLPAATLAKTSVGGQIKLFLSRELTGIQNFVVLAVGLEASDPAQFGANAFTSLVDQFNGPISRTPQITADAWHEIQVYEARDAVAHTGTARIWFDGKLVGQTVDPLLGSDSPVNFRGWQFGLVYTQNLVYPINVFVDDIKVGNGYIDP